jgi:hypothetical protein
MTIVQQLLETFRCLSPDQQLKVLNFAQSLSKNENSRKPLRSLKGLWADLDIHITEEDIAEARREMWSNFPRDIKL